MQGNKNKAFKCKRIPKVLLLGNGINRAFGASSWDDIIDNLSRGEFDTSPAFADAICKLPNSLRTVVISSDSVHNGMKQVSKTLMPKALDDGHRSMIRNCCDLGFDTILTTNYSYEIEKALFPDFNLKQGTSSKYRMYTNEGNEPQKQFGIYKYFEIDGNRIWHIHGEAAMPKSMILGHYYYGKLLSEIQNRVPKFIRSYKMAISKGISVAYKSWIDYFLVGDMHIIGLSLDPSEMDLWWLINCKKRNFSDCGKIYLYEPNMDDDKHIALRMLADTFGIKYEDCHVKGGEYREYYESVVKSIDL